MSLRSSKGHRPNKRKYEDLDDSRDSRVPLHNDEAFMHGLSFTSKFIGSLEVSKPSSRVEIVSCMRRIRYEFRAKSMKKTKATINISVSGVKVTKYIKKKKRRRKTTEEFVAEPQVILESPIYRIFYVSHDSLDKKIFSFIARVEAAGNRKTFVCAVFKAYKKSHALRIVRTIGQAFDICCKLQQSANAANIPGLLPPEKLKKLQEKKDGDEGTSVDDLDGPGQRTDRLTSSPGDMLNNFNLDTSVFELSELPPSAIVTLDDDYVVTLLEYQKHLYSLGQSLLLNSADMQQNSNEESLLAAYKLTPAQRQLMVLQFRVKQDQGLGGVFLPAEDTQTNLGRQDSILSKPLPSLPPNRLKVASSARGKFNRPGVGVTENASRDDSALLPKGAEGDAAANVPTELLVDTSIPEEPAHPVNPFTSATLLEDDERPVPKTDAQWVEMQKAQTAQLQLLKDMLSAETASRIDAQTKTHHILRQNKILAAYVMHIGTQLKRQQAASSSGTTAAVTDEAFSPPVNDGDDAAAGTAVDGGGVDDESAYAITEVSPVQASATGDTTDSTQPTGTSDMEMLSEILAASQLQKNSGGGVAAPDDTDEDFAPRAEESSTADAAATTNGQDRFSPFTFAADRQPQKSSTPQNQEAADDDGRFSPFEGFKAGDVDKPVVLFELPKAVTPLSDMDDDDNPLYSNAGPGYMPLGEVTADSGDDLGTS